MDDGFYPINIRKLKEAADKAQEALRGLMEAERELGWHLARKKLDEGKLGFLLDDE